MIAAYFRRLYLRTMDQAYARARSAIVDALRDGGACLECGAHDGHEFETLRAAMAEGAFDYHGVEWHPGLVETARGKGLDVVQGDLNDQIPFAADSFRCVFALSVLEHLLNPCRFIGECQRVLQSGGTLVLLTPNISTYFTAALILAGRMPSSGPHPDSIRLVQQEAPVSVSAGAGSHDLESDTPVHRHLVVFSYRVLLRYLRSIGFDDVKGYGFGLYPFPNFMQPLLEKVDPYHCHQMVLVARKH